MYDMPFIPDLEAKETTAKDVILIKLKDRVQELEIRIVNLEARLEHNLYDDEFGEPYGIPDGRIPP